MFNIFAQKQQLKSVSQISQPLMCWEFAIPPSVQQLVDPDGRSKELQNPRVLKFLGRSKNLLPQDKQLGQSLRAQACLRLPFVFAGLPVCLLMSKITYYGMTILKLRCRSRQSTEPSLEGLPWGRRFFVDHCEQGLGLKGKPFIL